VDFYSINGVKVKSHTLKQGINTIKIDDIERGIYFLKLQSISGRVVKKIVIE
jgi:hypothetical protein